MIALSMALAPPVPECVVKTPVAVAYETGDAAALVEAQLDRACFEASPGAAIAVTTRLTVGEDGFGLVVEARSAAGKSLGRVTREAAAPGAGPPPPDVVEGAVRDALGVLRNKLGLGPATRACKTQQDVVMLWHKSTSMDDRQDATRALAARCVRIKEEVDGNRRIATDLAAMLELPLIALRATTEGEMVSVAADVIDPSTETLTVKAHAAEKGREHDVTIRRALDAVLPKL